jgi:putative membrane protein
LDNGGRRRFPKRVYSLGDEPDPRFTLANERTFLAWLRTSLALIVGGAALEALGFPERDGFRAAAALVFIALGLAAAIRAWAGWVRTEKALRKNEALPAPGMGLLLVVGIVIGVTLMALGAIL